MIGHLPSRTDTADADRTSLQRLCTFKFSLALDREDPIIRTKR